MDNINVKIRFYGSKWEETAEHKNIHMYALIKKWSCWIFRIVHLLFTKKLRRMIFVLKNVVLFHFIDDRTLDFKGRMKKRVVVDFESVRPVKVSVLGC